MAAPARRSSSIRRPCSSAVSSRKPASRGSAGLFVIRNSRLDPGLGGYERADAQHRRPRGLVADPEPGRRRPLPHLRDDAARRSRLQPRLYSADFNVPLTEPFDQHYMNELFKLGYDAGRSGHPWVKTPPGYH